MFYHFDFMAESRVVWPRVVRLAQDKRQSDRKSKRKYYEKAYYGDEQFVLGFPGIHVVLAWPMNTMQDAD